MIIIHGVAPTAIAASITPLSISLSEVSTILAKKGIAAADNETLAAPGPIGVPTIKIVKGINATSKIINGTERTILTIKPITEFNARFSKNNPLSVVNSKIPSGRPITSAITREILII